MEILPVFEQMLVLLILLIVGVIASKCGAMDEQTTGRFTHFTLIIPQTCLILSSVLNAESDVTAGRVLGVLGIGCVMYAILVAFSFLVPQLYRCMPTDRGIYSFMTLFGNTGFMGIPVAAAIIGGMAPFYAALLNIPFNILAYTLGIAMLNSKGERTGIQWKLLINPPMAASFIAVILVCVHLHVPAPLTKALGMLGDMVVPCSMIIIGASLGRQKLKEVFGDWRVYAFAPMRLIAAPLLLWGIMHFIVRDGTLLATITLLGSMPVAAFATMLSIQYGGNVQMASKTVFVTTVLSVITVPLVMAFLPV